MRHERLKSLVSELKGRKNDLKVLIQELNQLSASNQGGTEG